MKEIKIKLGDKVKDKMTPFEGVAIGITEWIYGCRRVTVQPDELHEGRPVETHSFDEPQLKIIKPKKVKRKGNTGGVPMQMRRFE